MAVPILILSILMSVVASAPNFIFVLTDDQSTFFNSTNIMHSLKKKVIKQGVTFQNSFVATTKCCPSRVETITGRYFQNIRSSNDSLNTCMSVASQYNVINNTQSMFHMFSDAGYLTGVFGKLVNDQQNFWCNNNPYIADTFTRVNIPCAEDYYQQLWFDKYINKTYELHNITSSAANYLTSVVGNNSIRFLHNAINMQKPFLMWVGAHNPHHPATPPEWYANKYNNLTAPHTPNYNIQSQDKVSWIASNPSFDSNATYQINQEYRDRFRGLLSVDDIITDIFDLLNKYPDVSNNTYFVFSSDHGYHLGQWRIPTEKHLPYDTDLRVPLFMVGPKIKPNSINNNVVGNIDILPTMMSLAGINYDSDSYDGMDWSDIIINDNVDNKVVNAWKRDTFLSQYISTGTSEQRGNNVWFPGPDGSLYPGEHHGAGCCNAAGQPYNTDNTKHGNWRAIRIINETDNVMYVEWIKLPWNSTSFDNPYHHEFYDLKNDIYQMDNLYKTLPNYQQTQLHQLLSRYAQCKGNDCQ